jgi:hypothetical protein
MMSDRCLIIRARRAGPRLARSRGEKFAVYSAIVDRAAFRGGICGGGLNAGRGNREVRSSCPGYGGILPGFNVIDDRFGERQLTRRRQVAHLVAVHRHAERGDAPAIFQDYGVGARLARYD